MAQLNGGFALSAAIPWGLVRFRPLSSLRADMDIRSSLQDSLAPAYTLGRELAEVGPWRAFLASDGAGGSVEVRLLSEEVALRLDGKRLLAELEFVSGVRHRFIAPVLSVGTTAGRPFFVMRRANGPSMRERLDEIGELVLPCGVVQRVLRDVGEALEFAHGNGVAHGDLKPEYIFDAAGAVTLTDIGIRQALLASQLPDRDAPDGQRGAAWVGIPAYAPPEWAEDSAPDKRGDLYAFGCTAYELLAGKPPFTGRSPEGSRFSRATGTPVPLQVLRGDAPPDLRRLVTLCMQEDPHHRPESASEVLRKLDATTVVPLANSSRVKRDRPRLTRRRVGIIAGAALVVLASLAGAVRYVTSHQAIAPATESHVVAIVPFAATGADASLQFLREGMVDLMVAELSPLPTVRALNPRVFLTAWRAAGGSDTADLPLDAVSQTAGRAGADRVMTGKITGDASAFTISAILFDAGTRREVARASVQGNAGTLQSTVDVLASKLMTIPAGEGYHRIASLVSPSPEALRDYLAGRSAFRLGRFAEAARRYNAALDADSSAPLVAVRLLEVNGRVNGDVRDERATRIAMRNQARLAKRTRILMNVLVGHQLHQRFTGGEYIVTAESLTVAEPDSPDAWEYLGDAYYRFGAAIGMLNADRLAERAMTRSILLDSTFAPALERLPSIYAALHDTAGVRRTMNMLTRHPTADALEGEWLVAAAELGDDARVQAYRSRIPKMSWESLTLVELAALEGRAPMEDAERAVAAMSGRASTLAERERADYAAYTLALMRGQPKRADAINARNRNPVKRLARTLSAFAFWDGDKPAAAAAAAAVAELRRGPPKPGLTMEDRLDLLHAYFYEAEYRVAREDRAGIQDALSAMRSIPIPSDSGDAVSLRARLQMLVEVQLAQLLQADDVLKRLLALDATLQAVYLDEFTPAGALVSRLAWEVLGASQRALDAVNRPTRGWGPFEMFGSTRLRENGHLSEALGWRAGAVKSYEQFLKLRSAPEEALRADADRVRARMQALIKTEEPASQR